MTRVGFFDPYLGILGGGEKYLLSILEEAIALPSTEVVLFSPTPPEPERWTRLGVRVDAADFRWRRAGILSVTAGTRGLDLFVALSNGVPPLSFARRSVAIIQFPDVSLRDSGVMPSVVGHLRAMERSLRLRRYDTILCYSRFVAAALTDRLELREPLVVYPPVDTRGATKGRKGPSIIAVGRFFPAADANNKKHDVLIDAFGRLCETSIARGWKLHLVGGCHDDPASKAYLAALRRRAARLPVIFHPNATADALDRLYGESTLFWHAAGYGELRPERWEHFGITTAEAMAHGCVPLVPALGGQLEIVEDRLNGRLWRTTDELVAMTTDLISDPTALDALRNRAIASAERFSAERFRAQIRTSVLTAPAA